MRENVEQKGRRYLSEGRLVVERVDGRRIVASCRGSGAVYRLGFDPARAEWRCTCPARSRCAHLIALQLVTRAPGLPAITQRKEKGHDRATQPL